MENKSDLQIQFAETALKILNPTIEKFGFNLYKKDIEQYSTNIIWRKEDLFVRLQSTNYPTDYPYYYTIKFGENYTENFIIENSNSVALWRFIENINLTSEEYRFPIGEEIIPSVTKANEDLEKYGISFLNGDLDLFYQLRGEQNNNGSR